MGIFQGVLWFFYSVILVALYSIGFEIGYGWAMRDTLLAGVK